MIDRDQAVAVNESLVAAGDAEALYRMARWHKLGACVEQDYVVALELFRRLAEQGDARGMRELASMYLEGSGTEKNGKQALYWYREAASRGDLDAAAALGKMYTYGDLVPQDMIEAEWWNARVREAREAKAAAVAENWSRVVEQHRIRADETRRQLIEAKRRHRSALVTAIRGRYGSQVGIVMELKGGELHVREPRRKRRSRSGPEGGTVSGGGDGGEVLGYLFYGMPLGVALGLLAIAVPVAMLEAKRAESLSDEQKRQISSLAARLPLLLEDTNLERELGMHLVNSANGASEAGLFERAWSRSAEQESERYAESSSHAFVADVQTTGIGLVPVTKKYLPSRFVMTHEVKVVRQADGAVVDQHSVCYVSRKTLDFLQWGEESQKPLREEMHRAAEYVAQRLVDHLGRADDSPPYDKDHLCRSLIAG